MLATEPIDWTYQKPLEEDKHYILYESPVMCPENEPVPPKGWKVQSNGGAWPCFIVYDPKRIILEWVPRTKVDQLAADEKVLIWLPATKRGCHQIVKKQAILVKEI